MDHAKFALGSVKKETKKEKRARLRRKRQTKPSTFQPVPKQSSWFLLPISACKGLAFWVQMLKGDSFFSKRNSLLEEVAYFQAPTKKVYGSEISTGDEFRKQYVEKSKDVLGLLHMNQTFRWKWKNFLTKARMLRFQKVNEIDPITLDVCKQPISIHIFDQRKTYIFDAQTIARHIQKKLTCNDGHIPSPVYPQNPFTNEAFSLTQTMTLLQRCKEYGHGSWALEAFRACRYDMLSFLTVHSKPLRLQALHSTMNSLASWDCIDTLLDFIHHQNIIHRVHYNSSLYEWAVNNILTHEIMEQWRKLCIKWYELGILIDDDDIRDGFFDEIKKKTQPLCSKVVELQTLRLAILKSKRKRENGGGSSEHTENTG